jgi:cold shock protein
MSGEYLRGQVKWFNDAKGFGFIEHSSGRDVFVHFSVIEADGFKTLKDGESVMYELGEGGKGLYAAKVIRIIQAQPAALGATLPADGAMEPTAISQPQSNLQVEVTIERDGPEEAPTVFPVPEMDIPSSVVSNKQG